MMKKLYALLSLFLALQSYSCIFTVNLHDLFGDGWNGNSISIVVNSDTIITDITLTTGSDTTFYFEAENGDTITILYNQSGGWPSENEYTIHNPNFFEVWSDGQEGTVPVGGTFIADCDALPPPPPINDEPCTSINLDPVTSDCVFQTFTTEFALNNAAIPTPSCAWSYSGGDVWFNATVPASGRLAVTLGALVMNEGGVAVYSGSDCDTLNEITCLEKTGSMPGNVYVSELSGLAGQIVWIRVWDPGNDLQDSFNICVWENPPMLDVDTITYSPTELIEEVLVTGSITVSNVVYDGPARAIGHFVYGGIFGFESGIIMGCGTVDDICDDDTYGSDLNWISGSPDVLSDMSNISVANGGSSLIYDQVILEFDLVSSSEEIEINFVYASDEYPNFEHTSYNDVFAFFVNGVGISGSYSDDAVNIALIPGTSIPITISTVNGTDNSTYFGEYVATPGPEFNTGGYTIPITATIAGLIPYETYHMKFVIADAGDYSLDSYVMFEEGSLAVSSRVAEQKKIGIKVLPNPSKSDFTVQTNLPDNSNAELLITDMNGSLITKLTVDSEKTRVITNGWAKGTYFCNLFVDGKLIKTEKMILN